MAGIGDSFEQDMWGAPFEISVETVMRAWAELIRGDDPWRHMFPGDRTGQMRVVVGELLDVTEGLGHPARQLRLQTAAVRHGVFRGRQRCPVAVIGQDFLMVRKALRYAARRSGASRFVARELVRVLLPDCSSARHAARTALAGVRW